MTQRIYIKCPTCGHIYQLKIQMDYNLNFYDWPIVLECIECGDVIKGVYSKSGLDLKQLNYVEITSQNLITTMVGYSSSLPIVDEMYMKEADQVVSMVFFSPFMNLLSGYTSAEKLKEFESFLSTIQRNLLPFKNVLWDLLPIVKKQNVNAYCTKYEALCSQKLKLTDIGDVYNHYSEQIYKAYSYLKLESYKQNEYKNNLDPIFNSLETIDVAVIKPQLDIDKFFSEYQEVYLYIAKMINNIEKLIPSIMNIESDNYSKLKILTISHEDALNFYMEGYEVLAKILPFFVGICNMIECKNVDKFPNSAAKGVNTITDFARLPGGLMVDKLSDYQRVMVVLGNSFNNKIRNAISHKGILYDSQNQLIECYYNPADKSKVYKLYLIELSNMIYMQLLHIIEFSRLIYIIAQRTNGSKT